MQVVKVHPRYGWRWIIEGFRLLGKRPLAVLGLTVLFLFTLVVMTILPVVGGFAPLLLTPGLAVGYMQAVRKISEGGLPTPWTLYAGFLAHDRQGWKPLLVLGLINAALTALVLGISALADGGTLFRLATGAIDGDDPALQDQSLAHAALVFLLLYLPVQMAMWYAPVFVGWHGQTPVQALFFSLVAVWRNKAAFIVYMSGWFLVAVAVSLVLQLVRGLLSESLLPLLMSPISLAMFGALYCSFWPSYRDVVQANSDSPSARN